ncbi:MAG: hypothetical protein Q7S74_03930 [Nanoarchaeota archaeon]|nr:hypothetical protein [Nanoarchaeota archaeon]
MQQVKMPPIPLPPTSQQNQPTRPIFKQPSNFSIQKRNLFPNLLRRMPNARPLDRPSSRLIEVNPKLQTMALPPPPPPSSEGNKKDSSSGGKDKIDMGRIAQILRDPAVLSVECPGPGKNVLVNKAGLIQATAIKFTKEEINEILNEFAEQTRIPLVQGMFKAAFKDILITAVVSDFVGTRFVIQKRAPYQLY